MSHAERYVKTELYELLRNDPEIFDFLQSGSLAARGESTLDE